MPDEHMSDLEFPASIYCNGHSFLVTENLFDALENLSRASQVHYLWIDAISINQTDLAERSQQVLLMGDIYSTAKEVLVWLGKQNASFLDFYWVHTEFMKILEATLEAHGPEHLCTSSMAEFIFRQGLPMDVIAQKLLAYEQFLDDNRWFARAWIVQEVANARHIRVLCGETEVDWMSMITMARIFFRTGWIAQLKSDLKPESINTPPTASGSSVWRWQDLREVCQDAKQGELRVSNTQILDERFGTKTAEGRVYTWLFYVMSSMRGTSCRVPHDKVYAALGVASHLVPGGTAQLCIPDYSVPVTDVLTQVMRSIIENSQSINYLSFVEKASDDRPAGLPTWVPDFRSPLPVRRVLPSLDGFLNFNASMSRNLENFHCQITGRSLRLKEAAFDVIEAPCPVSTLDWISTNAFFKVLYFCCSLPDYEDGESKIERLWRTLVANTSPEGYFAAPALWAVGFKDFITITTSRYFTNLATTGLNEEEAKAELESISIIWELLSSEKELPKIKEVQDWTLSLITLSRNDGVYDPQKASLVEEIIQKDRSSQPFISNETLAVLGRRLFRTEKGLLGFASMSCQKGNEIWVVKDSHVPLLLRPVDMDIDEKDENNFELIGDCYVHGFMQGEMLDDEWGRKEKMGPLTLL
jgi:hypothetical protein